MTQGFTVAASDVGGAFVKDLAVELGKSASTLATYLRKHMPATLVKRKNVNNRLANFCTADGVAGLKAHYKPTYVPETNELVQELERLRDENKRLRALLTDDETASVEELEQRKAKVDSEFKAYLERKPLLDKKQAAVLEESKSVCEDMQEFIDYAEQKIQNKWRQTNELRLQRTTSADTSVRGREAVVNRTRGTVVAFERKDAKDS